jgi:hypothetical protein
VVCMFWNQPVIFMVFFSVLHRMCMLFFQRYTEWARYLLISLGNMQFYFYFPSNSCLNSWYLGVRFWNCVSNHLQATGKCAQLIWPNLTKYNLIWYSHCVQIKYLCRN